MHTNAGCDHWLWFQERTASQEPLPPVVPRAAVHGQPLGRLRCQHNATKLCLQAIQHSQYIAPHPSAYGSSANLECVHAAARILHSSFDVCPLSLVWLSLTSGTSVTCLTSRLATKARMSASIVPPWLTHSARITCARAQPNRKQSTE